MRSLALLALASASACALDLSPAQAAPEDFDGNVHYLWSHYDASDAELIDALDKLHLIINGASRTEWKRGGLKDLTADEVKVVGMRADADPTRARGMYLINVLPCTLDKVEAITIALDQSEQYPDVYQTYQRSYTSSDADYLARTSSTLTWRTTLSAKLVDAVYSSTLEGGVRRVTPPAASPTAWQGPALIARTWLPQPAEFQGGSNHFDQDYQLEVYYERAPGELMHVYPLWRELGLPSLSLSTDSDSVLNLITGNLQKWDENTARLCAR